MKWAVKCPHCGLLAKWAVPMPTTPVLVKCVGCGKTIRVKPPKAPR